MTTIFIAYETFTSGYRVELLDIISVVAIVSGIFTIISKNPVISVLFLIGLFLSISSYLIILGINFIGLSYLLVYVGAVSILFLFILMLINVRVSELLSNTSNSIPLAVIITLVFNYPLYKILPYGIMYFNNYTFYLSNLIRFNEHSFNGGSYLSNNKLGDDEILFVTSKV
jgi:NADH-ubiquinone oxidoreductase chain 6